MSAIKSIDKACVNTIRGLSMDAVQRANSGHPGMPMGMADAAYVLWNKFLKFNPKNPRWFDRDRFILSAGHGSMLIYSLLHLTGYEVSMEELKNFRQLGSITPGHPEFGLTPGVETTTGPLGQGFGTGIGMAIAEAHLAATFNKEDRKIVDHYTYGIVSDGDLMEGISHEAASLAGHLKLNKLIYLYDSNRISIDGSTDLAFTDDTKKRFEAYGWDVQQIDGHDHDEVERAIRSAQQSDKPSLIECKTHIGFGSPNKQDTADSHGSPLGEEEIRLTKEKLGLDPDKKFHIPDEVQEHMRKAVEKGRQREEEWKANLSDYEKVYPTDGVLFKKYASRTLPELDEILPHFEADQKGMATRKASGLVLNSICDKLTNLIGGSADLTGSNKTEMEGKGIFSASNRTGRNLHYGVREHGMSAALNGLALHGGVIPFGGTFLVFSDYSKPAIRIAGLSEIPSIFVFSHDSIGLGEDGPTHQPVEHIAALRATPNLHLLRPADANETSVCWKLAIEREDGPSLLLLTRQSVPVIDREAYEPAKGAERGAYILKKEKSSEKPDVILMATGSEVQLALDAAELLAKENISVRVVSMPCLEIFSKQDQSYRDEVLPPDVKNRISIEAATTLGWDRWTGDHGLSIGIDRYGESAPYEEVYEHLGFTPERIAKEAKDLL